jgi:phosphatidylglycerol:prolipoprotein diacylglycerol transferase
MSIDQYGIHIWVLYIRWYGIILMTGAVAAAFLAEHEARRRKLKTEYVWDALIWVLIAGIIGARLWHVFTPPPSMQALGYTTKYYLTHPLALIDTRLGGLGIAGAVIGGAIALYIYTRVKKLSFMLWADIAAPGVALAQAIGRWGNYFNQELYGKPTNLPFPLSVYIQNPIEGYQNYHTFQALFFYESMLNLSLMFLLLWMARKIPNKLREGDLFLSYLIGYPIIRFFLEFLRIDSPTVGVVNINQYFMLAVAIVAAFLLFWRHRKQAVSTEASTEVSTEEAEQTASETNS